MNDILGYTREGMPIYPCEPGSIYTAALVICHECHKAIRGMGGPMQGALCTECWPKKIRGVTLLVKRYEPDTSCDMEQDLIEAIDPRFNEMARGLPEDGTYTVIVKWEPNRATAE